MKSQFALTLVFLFVIASRAFAVSGDFIVASNLLDGQTHSSAGEHVGWIRPPYNYNDKIGQSFTPLSPGTLTNIVAMVSRGNVPLSATPPLDVSIYSSASGIPTTQLATLSLPAASFPSFYEFGDRRKTIDFSQFHIQLESNREYMVTFGTANGVASDLDPPYLVDWSPSSANQDQSLSLGRNFSTATDISSWHVAASYRELGIVVRAIPEPSTMLISVIGFAASLTRRKTVFHRRG